MLLSENIHILFIHRYIQITNIRSLANSYRYISTHKIELCNVCMYTRTHIWSVQSWYNSSIIHANNTATLFIDKRRAYIICTPVSHNHRRLSYSWKELHSSRRKRAIFRLRGLPVLDTAPSMSSPLLVQFLLEALESHNPWAYLQYRTIHRQQHSMAVPNHISSDGIASSGFRLSDVRGC